MPLVLKELASSDATNRRNAAFCVGELCKNGGDSALKYPFHAYSFDYYTRIILLMYVSLLSILIYDNLCQSILVDVCRFYG